MPCRANIDFMCLIISAEVSPDSLIVDLDISREVINNQQVVMSSPLEEVGGNFLPWQAGES